MLLAIINGIDALLTFLSRWVQDHGVLVGFFGAAIVFLVYKKQERDRRRDVAKLILQEIRYAEARVHNYRKFSSYNFYEKILPTNTWNPNINLFINQLSETQLDLISGFYSSATYLDEVIRVIADTYNRSIIDPDTPPETTETAAKIATGDLSGSPSIKKLVDRLSQVVVDIYNTPATDQLRKISEKKWYQLF